MKKFLFVLFLILAIASMVLTITGAILIGKTTELNAIGQGIKGFLAVDNSINVFLTIIPALICLASWAYVWFQIGTKKIVNNTKF